MYFFCLRDRKTNDTQQSRGVINLSGQSATWWSIYTLVSACCREVELVSGQCAVRNGGQFIHRSVAGGCAVAGSSENDARSF